jgi:hypothetical protein
LVVLFDQGRAECRHVGLDLRRLREEACHLIGLGGLKLEQPGLGRRADLGFGEDPVLDLDDLLGRSATLEDE